MKGYGKFWLGKRASVSAHRVAWQIANGPIPDEGPGHHGWCVCHRCDNPLCVNPDHLFLGSNLDNQRDKAAKGRARGQSQTRCKRGHELSGDNLRMRGTKRVCVACNAERGRAYYRANTESERARKRAAYWQAKQ